MKEDANVSKFNRVLLKYRFVEPVPPEVRRHIRLNKGRQFGITLKRAGAYSILFALISHLFFTLRKYGIGITIVKSALLLGILSLFTAAIITTGVYWFVIRSSPESPLYKEIDDSIGSIGSIIEKPATTAAPEEKDIVESPAVIENRIGVQPFHAENCPAALALSASDRMAGTLSSLRGRELVLNLRTGRAGRKSGMMLFGSVDFLEGAYTVTARVVSVKDSRILYYDSEIAGTENDIQAACDRLSRKIFEKIK